MLFIGIKNEIRKIFSMKTFIFTALIFAAVPFVLSFVGLVTKEVLGVKINNPVFSSHSIMMEYIMPLLAITRANRAFTFERKHAYIVNLLSKPISKAEVFISKIIAISVFCMAIIGVNLVLSLLFSMLTQGIDVESILIGIIAVIGSILPTAAAVLLASVAAQVTDSSFMNFIIFYLVIFIIFIIGIVFPMMYPATIGSITSFFNLFIENVQNGRDIGRNVMIMMGYIVLLTGIGGTIFENKKY